MHEERLEHRVDELCEKLKDPVATPSTGVPELREGTESVATIGDSSTVRLGGTADVTMRIHNPLQ